MGRRYQQTAVGLAPWVASGVSGAIQHWVGAMASKRILAINKDPEANMVVGFLHGKPSSAFSPVAVTPDELGAAWRNGKVHLPLLSSMNGELYGRPNGGVDMTFDFGALVAHAAKSGPLVAGTIVGSGTVSNKLDGGPGKPIADGGVGYSCIAELRTIETIDQGSPVTPFMHFGDRIRIEMHDADGSTIFGAIDQVVQPVPDL